jgi:hypothetical protein
MSGSHSEIVNKYTLFLGVAGALIIYKIFKHRKQSQNVGFNKKTQ